MSDKTCKEETCLLFAAGDYYSENIPLPQHTLAIAADGGADRAVQAGIKTDLTIGDFDSISHQPDNDDHHIKLPKEKDDTDMMAALKLGWNRGYRRFHIYGGLGGRIDHSIANVASLCQLAHAGGIGFLHGNGIILTAISQGSLSFEGWQPIRNRTISVFSASDISSGVDETGLKYELHHARMDMTMSHGSGISNEFLDKKPAHISVENGTLLITYPLDAPQPTWQCHVSQVTSLGELEKKPSAHLSQP